MIRETTFDPFLESKTEEVTKMCLHIGLHLNPIKDTLMTSGSISFQTEDYFTNSMHL